MSVFWWHIYHFDLNLFETFYKPSFKPIIPLNYLAISSSYINKAITYYSNIREKENNAKFCYLIVMDFPGEL